MFYLQLLVLPALFALWMGLRRRQQLRRSHLTVPFWIFTLLLWMVAGYGLWYFHRPLPVPVRTELAPGVTYIREVRSFPRQIVVHVVEFNLDQPGLEFLVTPADSNDDHPLKARTTTGFIDEFGVQVAINGSFFYPFHSNGPFDYYPHVGDPCSPAGFCTSRGSAYSEPENGFAILNISNDNRVTIGASVEGAYNAVSGKPILIKDGELSPGLKNNPDPLNSETAVAVDRSGARCGGSLWTAGNPVTALGSVPWNWPNYVRNWEPGMPLRWMAAGQVRWQ